MALFPLSYTADSKEGRDQDGVGVMNLFSL